MYEGPSRGDGSPESERLRALARETVAICERGGYGEVSIAEALAAAVAGTVHHLPDDVLEPDTGEPRRPTIEVTDESTLQAALRLPGAACLNFASARKPGGGFLAGARAQEEALARASGLYPCLQTAPEFYAFHREQGDARYSDRVIHSPSVPVFRDDDGTLLATPYTTSFLTCAAPNAAELPAGEPLAELLERRARRVLEVAAHHGHDTLVLGAWGCGVFGNDPATVARAFAAGLDAVPVFTHVTFAILDRPEGATRRAFADVLLG